jgi:hypothetical protein
MHPTQLELELHSPRGHLSTGVGIQRNPVGVIDCCPHMSPRGKLRPSGQTPTQSSLRSTYSLFPTLS